MHSFGWVWQTISGQFIHSNPLSFKLLLSKVKFHAIFSVAMSDNPANQRSQLNLFQNESWCTSFHMEMRFWLFLLFIVLKCNSFLLKSCAPGLILKQKEKETWKSLITKIAEILLDLFFKLLCYIIWFKFVFFLNSACILSP